MEHLGCAPSALSQRSIPPFPSLPGNEANLRGIDAPANISLLTKLPSIAPVRYEAKVSTYIPCNAPGFDLGGLPKLRVGTMWHFQCFLVGACVTDELGCGVGGLVDPPPP